jgi:uncharacterized protein YegP (UPF0339 family)
MATQPHFEIVRDKDGYHARFWSGTRIIWWTESYVQKSGAINAVHILEQRVASAPIYDNT